MKYQFDSIELAIDLARTMTINGHSVTIKQKYQDHCYGESIKGYQVEVSDTKDRIDIEKE